MALGVREITFSYPGEGLPLFEGLSFTIEAPGFYSLFGLSGAGKSTLAKILAGLVECGEGEVIGDQDGILYTHNEERFPGWETVDAHLREVTPPGAYPVLEEFLQTALNGVDLNVHFKWLSMGQKNRVNLARYLVQDFECLIIDEALSNVDEPTREVILKFLKRRFPSRTFLYISHNVGEVARFSRSIFVLTRPGESRPAYIKTLAGLDRCDLDSPRMEEVKRLGLSILEAASY